MNVLNVKIDSIKQKKLENTLQEFLASGQHTIYTPNPEMLVAAHKDGSFRDVLNRSSLNVCDGGGLQFALGMQVERIPGIDLIFDICKIAQEQEKSVYLLGSGDTDVLEKTSGKLREQFPNLRIVGTHPGIPLDLEKKNNHRVLQYNDDAHDQMVEDIIMSAPDILFVAFGHEKQEKWIDEQLPHLPSVRIAMGVGGAFDMISRKLKRAPKFMRMLRLEWLWRLIQQPSRIGRIWTAVIVFPLLVLISYVKR